MPSPSPSGKIQIMGQRFAWGVKAKHCWALSTNFWKQKVCWHHPTFSPQANFSAHNLNFCWRWRWWHQIQATFWNLFYLTQNWYSTTKFMLKHTTPFHNRVKSSIFFKPVGGVKIATCQMVAKNAKMDFMELFFDKFCV